MVQYFWEEKLRARSSASLPFPKDLPVCSCESGLKSLGEKRALRQEFPAFKTSQPREESPGHSPEASVSVFTGGSVGWRWVPAVRRVLTLQWGGVLAT